MKAYPETNQEGLISIENLPEEAYHQYIRGNYNPVHITGNLGFQVAEDGRIWINIGGVAFLRFKPGMTSKET